MSQIYRDRADGIAAKRQELLRRRRDELVTMPHAVRRVVVGRSARTAAAIAMTISSVALLITASSPRLAGWLAHSMPGIQPAPLATMIVATWLLGLCVYMMTRARVEHRFAVAMSRYVLPGDDLEQDIERLDHEHPDAAARQMAHGLEPRSAALPVLAAACAVPAALIYIALGVTSRGWPSISELELTLGSNALPLDVIALAGLVAGIVMTRRWARLPHVVAFGGVLAVVGLGFGVAAIAVESSLLTWLAVPVVTIGAAIAVVVRRLRIERSLIEAADPAAGSELFTWRGLIVQLRTSAAAGRVTAARLARKRSVQVALVACGITAIVGSVKSGSAMQLTHPSQASVGPQASPPPAPHDVRIKPANAAFDDDLSDAPGLTRTSDGRFKLDLDLDGAKPVVVPLLADLDTLPRDWRAIILVERRDSLSDVLAIDAFASDGAKSQVPTASLDESTRQAELDISACDPRRVPLRLTIRAPYASPGLRHVTLLITPSLGVARCPTN